MFFSVSIGSPQMSMTCVSVFVLAISCTSGFPFVDVVRNDAQFVFLDGLIFDQAVHQEAWVAQSDFIQFHLENVAEYLWLTSRGPQ